MEQRMTVLALVAALAPGAGGTGHGARLLAVFLRPFHEAGFKENLKGCRGVQELPPAGGSSGGYGDAQGTQAGSRHGTYGWAWRVDGLPALEYRVLPQTTDYAGNSAESMNKVELVPTSKQGIEATPKGLSNPAPP